jgi:hypothetical protein
MPHTKFSWCPYCSKRYDCNIWKAFNKTIHGQNIEISDCITAGFSKDMGELPYQKLLIIKDESFSSHIDEILTKIRDIHKKLIKPVDDPIVFDIPLAEGDLNLFKRHGKYNISENIGDQEVIINLKWSPYNKE